MKEKSTEKKVLITDPIHEDAIKLLEENGFSVSTELFPDPEKLTELLQDRNVLICRTNTKLTSEVFNSSSHLTCVALASTGYDQIDLKTATKNNIKVIGLPSDNKEIDTKKHGNFISTAEHTLMMILASLGDFYEASNSMKQGEWRKADFVGEEAYGKKLGMIGFGRISKLVAARARAFGMETLAYDPYVSMEEISEHETTKVDIESLCKESDIITIHAPKTEETVDLIDEKMFNLMKPGVVIVNVARSEIINKQALLKALDENKVRRIAIDVFTNEPHDVEWDLAQHKKVIPTPHIAGSTAGALRRISLSTAESLIDFFEKGNESNVINK